MTTELSAFKKDFEAYTNLSVHGTIEERDYPHWKRLILGTLDCDQMTAVTNYIKHRFAQKGMFTHLSPKIQSYNDSLVLTVDVKYIEEFILKTK